MTLNTAAELYGSQLCRALHSGAAIIPLKEFSHPFCFTPLSDSRTVPFLHSFSVQSFFSPSGAAALPLVHGLRFFCWVWEFTLFRPLRKISSAAPFLAK